MKLSAQALLVVLSFVLAGASGVLRPQAAGDFGTSTGESATLLPDGRWLRLGGVGSREIPIARAWHTATLLPSGEVLILGGVATGNRILAEPELLDPMRLSVRPLFVAGLTARASHSATLLTDGRVLVAGGVDAHGRVLDTLELLDPRTGYASPLPTHLRAGRYHQAAEMLADGSVLFRGGLDSAGKPAGSSELYDPRSQTVVSAEPSREGDSKAPLLAASEPADGSSEVPLDTVVSLRFSNRILAQSVHVGTVTLSGPAGPVAARVVPAEEGRLAFLTPQEPLAAGAIYTLSLAGLVDRQGTPLPAAEITFSTTDLSDRESPGDDQEAAANDSSWRALPPLQAKRGVTALAGQVLRLNGQPLADVTLEIGKQNARTDGTGRFLLARLRAGWHKMTIDARTAGRPGVVYGLFDARVEILEQVTSVLPFTIWMPELDTKRRVTLASPTAQEVVVTTPRIPGLEVHIPPGSVLRDHDGNIATEVSITAIPVDRPPFPLPDGVQVPIYYTVQPGGGHVETATGRRGGVRIVYPNYTHERPGTRVNFWHYDPDERGWYIYGQGTVDPVGRQVVPDPGVTVYELTGAMINVPGLSPPGSGPTPGSNSADGDPVDLGTGLFVMRKTDLALPDVLPLVLTRTYRPQDNASRPFGIGATHPYETFLWSASQYREVDLVLADGGRVHYVRTSPGTGFVDAVFEPAGTPSAFRGSTIRWIGGWELKLKDGSSLLFGNNTPLYAIRDRYGNTIRIERAATAGGYPSGDITRIVSPNGRWLRLTYDSSHRITRTDDNAARAVTYSYDSSGRLARLTDPAGQMTQYSYDSAHRMTQIIDPKGIAYLTNQYDNNGRVIAQKQADGSQYQFSYTTDGGPNGGKVTRATVTNPRGVIRQVSFNSAGYPVQEVYAMGKPEEQTFTYTRDSASQLVQSTTDPLNRKTAFEYNASGDLTAVTRLVGTAEAVTTRLTREPTFHQIASVTDPLGHTATITYDAAGSATTVTDPLGHRAILSYDATGRPLTATDPLGNTSLFSYEFGDLVAITDPLGRQTRRFVDAAGRLASVTDPLGRVTRYVRDPLNQITRMIDPLGLAISFSYDANGNLLSRTDARNSSTTYTVDVMDRILTRTDPLGRQESYQYDAAGNPTQTTDRKGQVTRANYDALNRLTRVSYADGSSITYTYDRAGRPTQLTDSLSGTISLTYDKLDRLVTETTAQGAVIYTYDAAGRRTSMMAPGQASVVYTYDNAHRLITITQGPAAVHFSYDDAGRRTSMSLPNGVLATYQYDAASELTTINYTAGASLLGTLTYVYDAVGNRVNVGGTLARLSLPQPLSSATYDAANQLTAWGTTRPSYDANGNQTSDGTRTYQWNARDQLIAIGGPVRAVFQYDALGRRVNKTVGGARTDFVYDGAEAVQERPGAAVPTNLLLGVGTDEVLSRSQGTDTRVLLSDALGSTVALAGSGGTVQTQYIYEPFGRTTETGTASSNSTQFTGRETDVTGIYYYRARYYDPTLQRFLSEDPVTLDGGYTSTYAYVYDNPMSFTDPSGQFAQAGVGCLIGALFSIDNDLLSGRKINWGRAAEGCGIGALLSLFGPELAALLADESGGGLLAGEATESEAAAGRLKGIPEDWTVGPSNKSGGTKYTDPQNSHNWVNDKPGDPSSPYVNSRGPHVRWQRDGEALDVNGNTVLKGSEDAHIPRDNFNYKPKLPE
jgi:RHS repeat-associated protein